MRRVLLIVVALALPLLVVACGGEEDKTTAPETVDTGAPAATDTGAPAATDTGGGETEPAETTEGGGEGDPEAGAEVFASAGCGGCHAFEAAGSSGTVGPNLDDADVSFDAAVEQITNGGGGMQAFKDQLSEEEIANVAAFITSG